MSYLQTLFTPHSLEDFFTRHWTQKALHVSARDPEKFKSLFSWKKLNYLLNYHGLHSPDLRFAPASNSFGESRDLRDWRDRLNQGATLIINSLDRHCPEVAEAIALVRDELGYRTQVNLYCSPPRQQGFNCHYDTHEVLVLQIEGEKQWFVYSETIPYPLSESRSRDRLPPESPPYLECTLKAGDLLYIPRGHWHYALAGDRASLHLTVGIDCQTGLDWWEWIARELREDPQWRQNLPLTWEGNRDRLERQLQQLSERAIALFQDPEMRQKYIEDLAYRDRPPLPIDLPSQLGIGIFDNPWESEFIWVFPETMEVKKLDSDYYQLRIASKKITLKGLRDRLADGLFKQERFNLSDLAEAVPEADFYSEIVPAIERLVTEGVLQVRVD